MRVTDLYKSCYSTFQYASNFKKNDIKTNFFVAVTIFSIVIPLTYAVMYGISSLYNRVSKKLPTQPKTHEPKSEVPKPDDNIGNAPSTQTTNPATPPPKPNTEVPPEPNAKDEDQGADQQSHIPEPAAPPPPVSDSVATSHTKEFLELKESMNLLVEELSQTKTYKRFQLIKLSDTDPGRNPPCELEKVSTPLGIAEDQYVKKATIYTFDSDVFDNGWGCVWDVTLTILSSFGITNSFTDLFHAFGPLDHLKTIYADKYTDKQLKLPDFTTPYTSGNGWGEPFITEMALHFFGINSKLYLVNGHRGNHAPKEVFKKTLDYPMFIEEVKNHFEKDQNSPIMIDDGTYAMCIIGIGKDHENNTTLWISDPHIQSGVQRTLPERKNTTPLGLYTVTLNANGDQLSNSVGDDSIYMFSSGTYGGINFSSKNWQVLFPIRYEA